MRNTWTIYRREIAAYFNSPIAYIFICMFLLICGFLFFIKYAFFSMPTPDVIYYYRFMPFVLPLFIPAVTMRLWAEEKRTGTIEILMTLPFRSWELVLGKYFASLTVILLTLTLTLVVPISCSWVATVDWGIVFSCYVGAVVVSSVYVAIGAWISTWSQNQIVSLLVSVVFCYCLYLLSSPDVMRFYNEFLFGSGRFLTWFGTWPHYEEFTKGLIHPVGLIYGFGLTAFFLILNNLFVEGRKY